LHPLFAQTRCVSAASVYTQVLHPTPKGAIDGSVKIDNIDVSFVAGNVRGNNELHVSNGEWRVAVRPYKPVCIRAKGWVRSYIYRITSHGLNGHAQHTHSHACLRPAAIDIHLFDPSTPGAWITCAYRGSQISSQVKSMPYPPYNPWVFRKADARLAQYVKDGAGKTRVDVRIGPIGGLRLKPVAPHGLLGQAGAIRVPPHSSKASAWHMVGCALVHWGRGVRRRRVQGDRTTRKPSTAHAVRPPVREPYVSRVCND